MAIKLYEKLGYSVYRRVVGYYNSSEDGYPDTLKKVDDNKDAFDMRKAMARDKAKSVRPDGRNHKCYPHDVRFYVLVRPRNERPILHGRATRYTSIG